MTRNIEKRQSDIVIIFDCKKLKRKKRVFT